MNTIIPQNSELSLVKYKTTDVGVIPEDWDAVCLGDICSMKSGLSITSASIDAHSPFPCFGGNGLRGFTSRFTHDGHFSLIGRQGALCGNVLEVSGRFFASEHAVVVSAHSSTSISWLTRVLQSMGLNRYSESSAQPGLSVQKLITLKVPYPKEKNEQRAIAEALGDVDALIAAQQKLLAKKQAIKTATMQRLLTGRQRLPGFGEGRGYKQTEIGVVPEDWAISRVGNEFSVQLGKMLDAEKNLGEARPYIGNRAVQWGRIDAEAVSTMRISHSEANRFRLEHGDLLVCEGGEVGRAAIWDSPITECYYQKALHRLRPIGVYSVNLMLQLLQFWASIGLLMDYTTQTSIAHLTKEKFELVPLAKPRPEEQKAIAQVLTDMDTEIAALEKRLTKTKAIKQGMMQELLTGRTRLV